MVSGWSTPPSSSSSSSIPYSSPATCSVYRNPSSTALDHHTDYPTSSQRTIIPSSQPSLSACLSSTSPAYTRNHVRSINNSLHSSWVAGGGLYALDNPDTSNSELPPQCTSSATSPSPRPPSSTASSSLSKLEPVKSDPEDAPGSDCFVMEFSGSASAHASSSLAPPTEVPLRATQASKAMRKMMGVFRLNPFSMHDSSVQSTTTWTGEEAGPLEEEPQMFEFQLHIPGCEDSNSDSDRVGSPSLHSVGENDLDGHDESLSWAEGSDIPSPHFHTAAPMSQPAWFGSSSPPSHTLPTLRAYSPHHVPHSPSLSSTSSSRRTPLDIAVSEYSAGYGLSSAGACASSVDNLPSISSMARRWSNPTNHIHAPFMI
ncbi:hypothetical protein ID866_3960 [Astraeus odoratus]|nr:hypothetical protein ID866_3960 [Astraeus odoratus]